jgi:hypothetical protein
LNRAQQLPEKGIVVDPATHPPQKPFSWAAASSMRHMAQELRLSGSPARIGRSHRGIEIRKRTPTAIRVQTLPSTVTELDPNSLALSRKILDPPPPPTMSHPRWRRALRANAIRSQPTRYNPSARLRLADLTNLHACGWRPMLLRYHGLIPSICAAQSNRDTQIEDDPIKLQLATETLIGASRAVVQQNLALMEERGLICEVTGQGRFRMWRTVTL